MLGASIADHFHLVELLFYDPAIIYRNHSFYDVLATFTV